MLNKVQTVGVANSSVILITFVLFAAALVTKGFKHDLFLELGVFLISVKLVLASYQIRQDLKNLREDLLPPSTDKPGK